MSDEESEQMDASQSEEELEDSDEERKGKEQKPLKVNQKPAADTKVLAKPGKPNSGPPQQQPKATAAAARAAENSGCDGSDSSSTVSQQQTGITSLGPTGGAHMVFDDGAGLSDDEANSWEDSVSESEGSLGGDDYDPEDYDEESPSPRKEPNDDKNGENADKNEDYGSEEDCTGRLTMNVHCTEYDVIRKVGRKVLGFKMREYQEDHDGAIRKGEHNQKLSKDWDVTWHDLSITPDFLSKLNPFQKVNHFPGMYAITRKNHLARNLMRMKRAFPKEFDFFPATWVLPGDNIDFRNQFNKPTDGGQSKRQTYIVKPDGLSQGKGIFLSRRMETILNGIETGQQEEGIGGWVVQHYLDQPHLVDDLKYDLRIYVLLNACNPMRVYIHEEGLARFCTEPYRKPTARNMDNLFMHLTNYAINKNSDAYQQAEDESSGDEESGHKRSLKAIMKILAACGADSDLLMKQIKDIIVKTMATSQPYLAHLYRSCQPEDLDNSMCFQILGFDIMIDKKFKPWLIEVNQSPSFATDSPLDYKTKKAVLTDTFKLLNCTVSKRKKMLKIQKAQLESRILTGKQHKMDPEEKARLREIKLKERFDWEESRRGQWELIYPWPEEDRNEVYSDFIKRAQEIWDEFTTGKGKRVSMEDKRSAHHGSSKQTLGQANRGPGALSNTNSQSNLRPGKLGVTSRVGRENSMKDLASNQVLIQNRTQGKAGFNRAPPHTSAGHPSTQTFDIQNSQAMQPSIQQLEIIAQASQEGGSPLLAQRLNSDESFDKLGKVGGAFKLNLKSSNVTPDINQQQQYRQHAAGQPVSIAEQMHQLIMPKDFNTSPLTNIKHAQLQKQANEIVLQLERHEGGRLPYQQLANASNFKNHVLKQHQVVEGAGGGPTNSGNRVSESKMSFMQRQIDAHEKNIDTYESLQNQVQKRVGMRNEGRGTNASANDSNHEMSPKMRAPHNNREKQSKLQDQKDLDAFTTSNKYPPSKLFKKSSNPALQKSPTSKGIGSAEGRQNLQIAGSEQMNFLIQTNYTSAKVNLEQLKQQVPQWAIKDHGTGAEPKQYGVVQGPFSSTWRTHDEILQQPSSSLQHAKLLQQKQQEMTQAAYENFQRAGDNQSITSQQHNHRPQASTTGSQNLAMTESKASNSQYQHLLSNEEGAPNRTISSSVKPQYLPRKEDKFESQTQIRVQESSEFLHTTPDTRHHIYGNTAGSNGFPNLNHLNDSNDLSAVRTMKLPQKQAIKMTQMPIFIQEPGGTHRMVTSNKKKETPKQKFKALPGIGYSQHEIPKTVVKGSTSKLHGLKDSRTRPFEPQTVKLSKNTSNTLKAKPNYNYITNNSSNDQIPYTGEAAVAAQQYFVRRQVNKQGGQQRVIGGCLPVTHQPIKIQANAGQLHMMQVPVFQALHKESGQGDLLPKSASASAQKSQGAEQPQRREVQVAPTESSNQQQQTTTMKRAGNQKSAGMVTSQPTPFQLYQQQQQMQQMRCANGQPPPPQQQRSLGGNGQVGAMGGTPGKHQVQQQNQFILQKNNNQRQQQNFQPQNSNIQQQQKQPFNSMASQPALTCDPPQPQHSGTNFNHAKRVLHAPGQPRTSSSRGNQVGSGANNRRLGRALGQGKSVGVPSLNNGTTNNKNRGQTNGSAIAYAPTGNPNQPTNAARSQFYSSQGKPSIGIISSQPVAQQFQQNRQGVIVRQVNNGYDKEKGGSGLGTQKASYPATVKGSLRELGQPMSASRRPKVQSPVMSSQNAGRGEEGKLKGLSDSLVNQKGGSNL